MRDKLRDASAQRVENLQAAAWRAMGKLGYNDVQARQWREMQNNPHKMQDHVVRAAQAQGYVRRDEIDAFASKFIADMERQFGD